MLDITLKSINAILFRGRFHFVLACSSRKFSRLNSATPAQQNGDNQKPLSKHVKPVQQVLLKRIPVEFHGIEKSNFSDETVWVPIYRMPYIQSFRSVIRFKVYLTFASLIFCTNRVAQLFTGDLSIDTYSAAIMSSITLVSLVFIGNYFRRLICQIYATEDLHYVRISRFTFFGKRLDMVLPISCVIPLTELNKTHRTLILKCKFERPEKIDLTYDTIEFYDEHLFIPLRLGGVLDREKFVKIMGNILTQKVGA